MNSQIVLRIGNIMRFSWAAINIVGAFSRPASMMNMMMIRIGGCGGQVFLGGALAAATSTSASCTTRGKTLKLVTEVVPLG